MKSHQIARKPSILTSESNRAQKVSKCHFKEIDLGAFCGPGDQFYVVYDYVCSFWDLRWSYNNPKNIKQLFVSPRFPRCKF